MMTATMPVFRLPRGSRLTLRDQICEVVSSAIARSALPPDLALPSCRELAQQLGVSRNTVFAAFSRLVDLGLIEARDRSGYYISKTEAGVAAPADGGGNRDIAPSPMPAMEVLPSALRRVRHPADWQTYPYPFVYNQTDSKFFPIDAWRECSRLAHGRKTVSDWTRDSIEDDSLHLIEQLRQRLLTYRGIAADEEEVMITLGAQNALCIIGLLLRPQAGVVAMEDPGFPDARNAFALTGNQMAPVRVDQRGLVVDDLPPDCKLAYVTPSHQFPTSITMTLERRLALLRAASQRRFLILEDDYEAEMESAGRPSPTLRAIDTEGRVIYVGSMSKTLSPGLRLGFIVAHRTIIREARAIRRAMLRHAPTLLQETLALFLQLGYYDTHLRKLVRRRQDRWLRMDTALRAHLPGFDVQSSGGTSFWLTGKPEFDATVFCQNLLKRGVIVDDGRTFYMQGDQGRSFRLATAMVDGPQIDEGVRLIGAEAAIAAP